MSEPQSSAMITSSAPPRFPEMQEALFREVLCVLHRQGLPFAISGAFALHQCTGIWRQTKDLDIFLKSEDASLALCALREDGFACEVPDPVWLAKAHRGDFFVDLITGMSNAVITVDDSWIERAIPAVILGLRTRVLAPEELLAS